MTNDAVQVGGGMGEAGVPVAVGVEVDEPLGPDVALAVEVPDAVEDGPVEGPPFEPETVGGGVVPDASDELFVHAEESRPVSATRIEMRTIEERTLGVPSELRVRTPEHIGFPTET